jgi:hypothetical protein
MLQYKFRWVGGQRGVSWGRHSCLSFRFSLHVADRQTRMSAQRKLVGAPCPCGFADYGKREPAGERVEYLADGFG